MQWRFNRIKLAMPPFPPTLPLLSPLPSPLSPLSHKFANIKRYPTLISQPAKWKRNRIKLATPCPLLPSPLSSHQASSPPVGHIGSGNLLRLGHKQHRVIEFPPGGWLATRLNIKQRKCYTETKEKRIWNSDKNEKGKRSSGWVSTATWISPPWEIFVYSTLPYHKSAGRYPPPLQPVENKLSQERRNK